MAKKKKSSAKTVPMTSPEAVVLSAAPPPPLRDPSPEKGENLRMLNHLLLKETVERREQVNQLQSRIDDLAGEHSVLNLLERDVTRLVVAFGIAEASAADGDRREVAHRLMAAEKAGAEERVRAMESALKAVREKLEVAKVEKEGIEKALGGAIAERDLARSDLSQMKSELEVQERAAKNEAERLLDDLKQRKADLRSLEAEKVVVEEKMKSLEESLRSTNKKLVLVDGEKSELKIALDRAVSESDSNQRELSAMRKTSHELHDQLKTLRAEFDELKKQKEATRMELQEIIAKINEEKIFLEEKIGSIEREKADLEEEKAKLQLDLASLEEKVAELQSTVSQKASLETELREANEVLKEANQKLDLVAQENNKLKKDLDRAISESQSDQMKLAEKEEENDEIVKGLDKLQTELGFFQKQKDKLQQELEAQKLGYETELDGIKNIMKKIEQEKGVLEGLRAKQDNEIADLKNKLQQLELRRSELQELYRVSDEKNIQLIKDVESARNDMLLQKREADGLRAQIEELKKSKEDTERELQKVKAALDGLVLDKEETKNLCDSLSKEKAFLEEKLAETQHMFHEMEVQTKTSKVNTEKAFTLLRSTSDVINGLMECKESDTEEKVGGDELQFEIQQFEKILDDIKLAFKSRIEKNEDMTRELELLQGALVEANKKKGGIWIWLYPAATTILAAISFAYAAAKSR